MPDVFKKLILKENKENVNERVSPFRKIITLIQPFNTRDRMQLTISRKNRTFKEKNEQISDPYF
jgi:hypothetical protein